eukprot:538819_1
MGSPSIPIQIRIRRRSHFLSDLRGFDSEISKRQMGEMIDNTLSYSKVVLLLYSTDSRSSFEGDYSVHEIKQYMDKRLSVGSYLLRRNVICLTKERCVAPNEGES